MDPITTAIVAVLPALASDLIKASLKEAYDGLKGLILSKWGKSSPVGDALLELENNPESKGQAIVLAERLASVKAADDVEIMQAAAKLIEEMRKDGIGGPTIANITVSVTGGTQAVVGAQNVSIGSLNLGERSARPK